MLWIKMSLQHLNSKFVDIIAVVLNMVWTTHFEILLNDVWIVINHFWSFIIDFVLTTTNFCYWSPKYFNEELIRYLKWWYCWAKMRGRDYPESNGWLLEEEFGFSSLWRVKYRITSICSLFRNYQVIGLMSRKVLSN